MNTSEQPELRLAKLTANGYRRHQQMSSYEPIRKCFESTLGLQTTTFSETRQTDLSLHEARRTRIKRCDALGRPEIPSMTDIGHEGRDSHPQSCLWFEVEARTTPSPGRLHLSRR
jgi:hypothetical protein